MHLGARPRPRRGLEKAKDLTAAAVAKARFLAPLEMITVPVTKRAMVIGGGVAGISTALDLADQGIETILVEKEPTIGGVMAQLNKTFPTMVGSFSTNMVLIPWSARSSAVLMPATPPPITSAFLVTGTLIIFQRRQERRAFATAAAVK